MRLNFTHDDYRRLINELGGAGYEFLFFPEAEDRLGKRSQFALLRHDVDIDLEPASALAEVDARLNVNSTYFFMLRTSHYNVFSQEGSTQVRRILAPGHALGLHFDCAAYPEESTVAELAAACRREATMLGDWFGQAEVDPINWTGFRHS